MTGKKKGLAYGMLYQGELECLAQLGVTDAQVRVYAAIVTFRNARQEVTPAIGYSLIGNLTGRSKDAARMAVNRLVEKKALDRYPAGKRFRFEFPLLQQCKSERHSSH